MQIAVSVAILKRNRNRLSLAQLQYIVYHADGLLSQLENGDAIAHCNRPFSRVDIYPGGA
jgi:predicted amidohydrolase